MELLQIELKKTKFFALFFDGSEKSAKEICRKWGCDYIDDFLNSELKSIAFPNGKRCYGGNYIVIDNGDMSTYTKKEFEDKFNIIVDRRTQLQSFMSED